MKDLWGTALTMEPSFSSVLKGKEPKTPKELNAMLRQCRESVTAEPDFVMDIPLEEEEVMSRWMPLLECHKEWRMALVRRRL